MKYFVEELHTKNEWVYKCPHTILLSTILTFILLIGVVISVIIGVNLQVISLSNTLQVIFIVSAVLLDLIIVFSIGEWLGKSWSIYKRVALATILKRKVNITFEGFNSRIVKIPRGKN